MNKRLMQVQSVIVMIFAAIGFVVVLNFLDEKLKIGWLFQWIFLGTPIVLLVFGLILRNIRGRGWH